MTRIAPGTLLMCHFPYRYSLRRTLALLSVLSFLFVSFLYPISYFPVDKLYPKRLFSVCLSSNHTRALRAHAPTHPPLPRHLFFSLSNLAPYRPLVICGVDSFRVPSPTAPSAARVFLSPLHLFLSPFLLLLGLPSVGYIHHISPTLTALAAPCSLHNDDQLLTFPFPHHHFGTT